MSTFSDFNFKGVKALVRVDFNIPLNAAFEITDDTRMRAVVPTVEKILNDGGSAILMSHLGRPKDGPTDKYSLKHLIPHLSELLKGKTILFANDCIGEQAVMSAGMLKPGEVLLLENLRFHKEEEKGDKDFAQKLAKTRRCICKRRLWHGSPGPCIDRGDRPVFSEGKENVRAAHGV